MRKKAIAGAVAVAIAAAIYFVFFAASDEEKIRGVLAHLARTVSVKPDDANIVLRTVRVRSELGKVLDPNVHISVPDLPSVQQGRDQIAEAVAQAALAYRSAEVDLSDMQIKIDPARTTAKVGARAVLRATTRAGEDRRDERNVDFLLRKDDGTWRVSSITVWAKERARAGSHGPTSSQAPPG